MVNCPKCNFTQPRDQYCARCGIDMLAFRPAQKPLHTRVLKNTKFQFVLLIVVISAVFALAKNYNEGRIAKRIASIEDTSSKQILTRSTQESSDQVEANVESESDTELAEVNPGDPNMATNDPTVMAAAAPVTTATESSPSVNNAVNNESLDTKPESNEGRSVATISGSSVAASIAANVQVTFAEVPRAMIAEFIANNASSDSRNREGQGPIVTGVLTNMQERLRAAGASIQTLDTSSRSLQLNQNTEIYGGQRESTSGQFLGFMMDVTPVAMDEAGAQVQVRVWRSMRDPNARPPVEELALPLPENYRIPRGGAAFIAGALPIRRSFSEQERRSFEAIKTLRVLNSEDYVSGATDLVILIEPR